MQAEATQSALTNLYSRNFLPANPFPLLADVLSASIDQDGVWRLTNQQASLSTALDRLCLSGDSKGLHTAGGRECPAGRTCSLVKEPR